MKYFLALLAAFSVAVAAPFESRQNGACGSSGGDAPFSMSCGELASRVVYPQGNQRKQGGTVFLVHGTGSQGDETWGPGPYASILPGKGPGYDIAWFNSPSRSLGDAQITAEYIAYNVKRLAQDSTTGKVFVISHSQGGINVQWALAFYPSIRQYVSGFASLSGSFHGTTQGPLLCLGQNLLQGGCEPSVYQQSIGSRYLGAQNSAGGSALVNTLALYTTYDEIVVPQGFNPSSALNNANNVRVQDLCTPAYITDHFGMTVAAPAFYATLQMLTKGYFDQSTFNPLNDCSYLLDNPAPNPFVTVPGVIKQAALDAIAVVTYPAKVRAEPKFMSYVCQRGAASSYCK